MYFINYYLIRQEKYADYKTFYSYIKKKCLLSDSLRLSHYFFNISKIITSHRLIVTFYFVLFLLHQQ